MAGARYDSWGHFFRIEFERTKRRKHKALDTHSRVCNRCYCACGDNLRKHEGRRAVRSPQAKGAEAYRIAASNEEVRVVVEEAARKDHDEKRRVFWAKQLVASDFRVHVLRIILAANRPTSMDQLVNIWRDILRNNAIAGPAYSGAQDEVKRLKRMAGINITAIWEKVDLRIVKESRSSDGRGQLMIIYPAVDEDTEVAAMVDNTHQEIRCRRKENYSLHQELDATTKPRPTGGLVGGELMVAVARALKGATVRYARDSSKHVSNQRTGILELECIHPQEEFKMVILRAFVKALSRRSDDGDVASVVETQRAGPKCLLSGILTTWAHKRGWFKNANTLGIFLKENGLNREGIDDLTSSLGITCTAINSWRLTQTLSKQNLDEALKGVLLPKRDDWMAVSFDNVNLRMPRHYGSKGQVGLIAGIGYHHVEYSEARVPAPTEEAFTDDDLETLGFQAHIGRNFAPAKAKILAVAMASVFCIGLREYDGLESRERYYLGNFETRVARRLIADSPADGKLGVENRWAGRDFQITYLDVEELGTKKVEQIAPYLDLIHERAHVGVEGGRDKVMVVGDQETWALMWKAKEMYGDKYSWIVPWPGD